ncbi:type II secretion system F family protein [Dissulfurirhabdus thermomarina]|uniref:Type II secretion system F family protein n=1 Tax=Dissulfurirhabdus thermomarina TaxID=1765737 RepID=A0A6N9TTP8_DISTH|nr:type II secretion system F family protein [Dissulfurirhabdus thermomarina]NDY42807.1 type II secretion system F family protein [Dissulfurirhabdus thermomarina]NMX24385.1 type II secretion system F family protein [Dissulfurirhabdus thermomarina]
MPVYIWEGTTRSGEKRKGELEAQDEKTLRLVLQRQRITPTKVKKKPKDLFENVAFLQPKVKTKDVVVFTRQLSTMIDAGLPLIQALDVLATQQENKTFQVILKGIKADVEGGGTFADALRKHPKQFDGLYCNMVQAGEIGGNLDEVLNRLAEYMEKAERLKAKVKSAMTYPAIVLCIAGGVLAVIMIFVIPTFEKMFADFGGALPGPTQLVIDISKLVKKYFLAGIGAAVVAVFLFKRYYATDAGRKVVDRLLLKAPVFGILLKKVAVAKFTRTLGTLLNSGVAIIEALNVAAGTAGNRIVEEAIYQVRASISEGRTIAQPLEESGIFPSMVVSMIGVGETSGALDEMLNKIADFYDEEVDTAVDGLTSMIEPFMIVFLGGSVGSIIIAMYLPIFKMASVVGG